MKICPTCNAQLNDDAAFCTNCGTFFNDAPAYQQTPNYQNYQTYQAPAAADPYDHTAEFDAADISENKVIAMLIYLLGIVGIILALLMSNQSKYVGFHMRQSLKILVVDTLAGLCAAILCWTLIVPLAASILIIALSVVKIICFVQICKGQAKEPFIIRKITFLK